MDKNLSKVIINRLRKDYNQLGTNEEKIEFGIKYAGRYNLAKFIGLMNEAV